MTHTDGDPDVGARLDTAAEGAFRARHNAETLRHQAMAAGRAAADSLKRSAESIATASTRRSNANSRN
jgi:hypothetical protein